jgi:hypothetical protein
MRIPLINGVLAWVPPLLYEIYRPLFINDSEPAEILLEVVNI